MKKLFLFLFISVFLISLVSAGQSCTQSGYRWCWEHSNTYGDATARARIYWQFEDEKGNDVWDTYPYAVKNLYIKAGWKGEGYTVAYGIYNAPSWDNIWDRVFADSLNHHIMNQYDIPLINAGNGGKTKIASQGSTFTKCLVAVALDTDITSDHWAYAGAGYGWIGNGNCVDIKVVECYQDSDCSSGYVCDKSGDWTTWNCKQQLPCVTSINYDSSRSSEVRNCVVWQWFEEYQHCEGNGWFFYVHGEPVGTLIMTEEEYKSITLQECWFECQLGDEKCEGFDYYICENNKWENQRKTIGKCGVECLSNSDCPTGDYIGNKYCSNDNVVQKYRNYSCDTQDYTCGYIEEEKVLEICELGCEEGVCIGEVCIEGDIKYYTCPDGSKVKWCTCENKEWNCIISPETQCEEKPSYLLYIVIAIVIIFIIGIITFLILRRKKKK